MKTETIDRVKIQHEMLTYSDFANLTPEGHDFFGNAHNASWTGATIEKARHLIKHGDLSQVDRAQKLQDKFTQEYNMHAPRMVMSPDVVGCFPNVPAMLAGIPETMLAPHEMPDNMGEIVIIADIFISASFKKEVFQRRGAALLALVQYLQAIRPVRLLTMSTMRRNEAKDDLVSCFVELPYNPLDIARAGFLLAHTASYRIFGIDRYYNTGGMSTSPWSRPSDAVSQETKVALLKKLLGAENVLLTPDLVSASGETPFDSDDKAASWVQAQINAAMTQP